MSRGHAGGVALRARGFRDIAPDQALHSFDAMFERRRGAVLVGLDRTNHFIRRQLAAGPIATSKVTAFVVTDRPAEVAVAAASRAVADRFGTASTCDLAFLRALPKHADGKIDRAALTASSHTVERVAPRTEAERRVAEAWHEVMGGISPGVYDNFFEQGGHSLLATRVLARLKARWGIDLPLRAHLRSADRREARAEMRGRWTANGRGFRRDREIAEHHAAAVVCSAAPVVSRSARARADLLQHPVRVQTARTSRYRRSRTEPDRARRAA